MSTPKPLSPSQQRTNFALGVGNGAMLRLFSAMTDPSLVLTWLVSRLGASAPVIGLLLPILNGGWFLPQLLTTSLVQRRVRKLPIYRAGAVFRALSWILLTVSVFVVGARNASLLLTLFLLFYTLYCFGGGLNALAFMDVVAKAVPTRERGSFFAWREFTGGLLSLGGSTIARYLLDERRQIPFPLNFAWVFVIAGVAVTLGLLSFSLITEPQEDAAYVAALPNLHWRRLIEVLRHDHNYALFVLARMALLSGMAALPFYSVFAIQRLHAPTSMAGTYLAACTCAMVGSTLWWGWVSRHYGNRTVVWLTSLLSLSMPLVPLVFGTHISYLAYGLVFVLQGAVVTGSEIGCLSLVLDVSPAAERPLYVGLINTVLGVVSLASAAEGWVVQMWGLNALFALSLVCLSLSAVFLTLMHDPVVG